MKKAILSLSICCLILLSSLNLSAQCTYENLWEQSPEFPSPFDGKAFLHSQQFVQFGQGKAFKGADDFEVPEGMNWMIDGVSVNGAFSFLNFEGEVCGNSVVEAIVVEIYSDYDGLPSKRLWREEIQSIINTNSPNFDLEFEEPPIVSEGRYWLSVFPIMANECGQWYWVQSSPGEPRMRPAAFLDEIYNKCKNEWVTGTDDCILGNHFETPSDLAFSLKTCVRVVPEVLSIAAPNTEGNATDQTVVSFQFMGGIAPYTYKWETNGVVFWNEFAPGLFRVVYTGDSYWKVTAVDSKGQIGTFTNDTYPEVDGNEGGLLDVYDIQVSPENGVGGLDGSLTFCIEGGTRPYYIEASNGETVSEVDESGCFILSNLAGGSYDIEVSDNSDSSLFTTANGYVNRLGGRGRGRSGRGKAVVDGITNMVVFPNPFTYSTNIEFLSTTDSFAEMVIYDVNGQEVAHLFDKEVNAGEAYRIPFNASTLQSGIYFAQLRTDSEVITQKILMY
ncbi:MAG: T9SS type A sorting domain-containing protein [Chitinophagales bacterium]